MLTTTNIISPPDHLHDSLNVSKILGTTPTSAETMKRISLSEMNASVFAATGSAFIVALDTALFPLNTIQTIMMSDRSQAGSGRSAHSIRKMVSHILKTEGLGRFWKGAGPAIVGSFPGQAFYYMTYETSQEITGRYFGTSENATFWRGFLSGASADFAAGLFYVPADVVAQRLQTQNCTKELQTLSDGYYNKKEYEVSGGDTWATFQLLRQQARYITLEKQAFYRGLKARLLTTVPGVVLAMSGYETIKEVAERKSLA
ncbi:hypothetical protein HDV05_006219 [Chytridiales sp. JEL 0842]|nr:hypothetical protein HDV05_006219 [Chytridiales sp. JEL 0842]